MESSAPEKFQCCLNERLQSLENITVVAHDIHKHKTGETNAEAEKSHDDALIALFQRCRGRRIKLNHKKPRSKLDSVIYMGHMFSKNGVSADPEKILTVTQMKRPEDINIVQRLLGVNIPWKVYAKDQVLWIE